MKSSALAAALGFLAAWLAAGTLVPGIVRRLQSQLADSLTSLSFQSHGMLAIRHTVQAWCVALAPVLVVLVALFAAAHLIQVGWSFQTRPSGSRSLRTQPFAQSWRLSSTAQLVASLVRLGQWATVWLVTILFLMFQLDRFWTGIEAEVSWSHLVRGIRIYGWTAGVIVLLWGVVDYAHLWWLHHQMLKRLAAARRDGEVDRRPPMRAPVRSRWKAEG